MSGAVRMDAARLRGLLRGNALFDNLTDEQLAALAGTISEVRVLSAGDYLMREGEAAHDLFLVQDGELEVLKEEQGEDVSRQAHRLAVLTRGMSVGEVSLLDSGARSASVRALIDATVLVLPIARIERLSHGAVPSLDVQMKINLAHQLGRRLRTTNVMTVQALRERLDEAETRAEMGKFLTRVLTGTCLYMFALSATMPLSALVEDTALVTVPILIAFAIALYVNVKASIFPASAYGFTLHGWRPAVREALLFSVPVAAVIVLFKFALVHTMPQMMGTPVFELSRSDDALTVLASAIAYSVSAPVQEMVARSGMQSSFMMFLTSRYKVWWSIFLSTLLFSSIHLHVSVILAVLVFPFGLFWGWLYARHPTLVGVSLSHIAIGLFALYVVGIPGYQ
jgi:CRP-like cAMP-binding protein/membrane protease YdiL (CAAX protease family)